MLFLFARSRGPNRRRKYSKVNDIFKIEYAEKGWRLHTIFTNEVGKTVTPMMFIQINLNATIDQTVMVFERCIKPDES